MRTVLFAIFPFLITFSSFGQGNLRQQLIKNWKKTDISAIDGSPYYDDETANLDFDLNFFSSDSVYLFNNSRLTPLRYRLTADSLLVLSGLRLKIREISDIRLVVESLESEGFDFKMTYTPKPLFDLTYTPEAYRAKNGEVVFTAIHGKLEPQFVHKTMSPVDYIFEQFGFPEYRKGGFVVRFVVTAKGELTGIRVVASSNDRFNDKLVNAVLKTKGMWKPAEFKGEKVATEVEYDYNLGYNDRNLTSEVDSVSYSKMYLDYGLQFISTGAYRNAATYLKKAIDFNPLNVEAYFKHAEVSFALRRKDEGCESLSYLLLLEQKKAEPLYEKHCK
ncbi:energy transducer TonB [Leadbetterella sp. DM7]|uniref:energy transducer TonB n=1 Tax=Leadbetterella sp. DM7 TaxID=3235085 RepID=UPI00349E51E1